MLNWKFLLVALLFISLNCTMHHFKINDKPAVRHKLPKLTERKNLYIDRVSQNTKGNANFENLVASYNSENLNRVFENGCCVLINKKSNYTLRYSTNIKEETMFPVSVFFF